MFLDALKEHEIAEILKKTEEYGQLLYEVLGLRDDGDEINALAKYLLIHGGGVGRVTAGAIAYLIETKVLKTRNADQTIWNVLEDHDFAWAIYSD